MPRRASKRTLAALLLVPSVALAQEAGKDWLLEPLTWTQQAEGVDRVSIVNRFGAVRVGGTSGALAEVAELHGMVQRHVDDPRAPEVVRTLKDGSLSIEVVYPGDDAVELPPDAWRKRRIDITLYVAATSHLTIETLHGSVLVKGFSGPLAVTSESGDLDLRTTGSVVADCKYGTIDTFFTGETLAHPFELETVTGAIHLSLPWKAQPRALIETRGEISSDYSIGIEWSAGSALKRGTVAVSDASEPVVLRSNRGNVRLLRRIEPSRSVSNAPEGESIERQPRIDR